MATKIYHRTSGKAVGKRLRNYPIKEWLTGDWFSAIQDEDFTVTRKVFQQDLHNLARRQTTLAAAGGQKMGWVVETSMSGLPEEEIQFCFSQRPLELCPSYRAPRQPRLPHPKKLTEKQQWCVWMETPEIPEHKLGTQSGCTIAGCWKGGEQPAEAEAEAEAEADSRGVSLHSDDASTRQAIQIAAGNQPAHEPTEYELWVAEQDRNSDDS